MTQTEPTLTGRVRGPAAPPATPPTATPPTATDPHTGDACAAHRCDGPTRRDVLRGAGAVSLGAAALALAACSGGSGGSGRRSPSAVPSGTVLAKVADVPVGGALPVEGPGGVALVLVQPTEGTVVALSAICTHQGCTVAPRDGALRCPCHGSVFSAEDGAVVNGPAEEPLPQVPVRVVDGDVVTA